MQTENEQQRRATDDCCCQICQMFFESDEDATSETPCTSPGETVGHWRGLEACWIHVGQSLLFFAQPPRPNFHRRWAVNVEGRSSWRITAHTAMCLKVWTTSIRRNAKQKQNNVCLEILKQRFSSTCPLSFKKSCFPVSWLTALALGSTLCHCGKRWTYPQCFEYFCPSFLWRKTAETWHMNLSRTRKLKLLGFTSWAHGGDRGRHTASHTAHRRQCLFLLNKEMIHIAQRCSKPLSFRSRRTLKQ